MWSWLHQVKDWGATGMRTKCSPGLALPNSVPSPGSPSWGQPCCPPDSWEPAFLVDSPHNHFCGFDHVNVSPELQTHFSTSTSCRPSRRPFMSHTEPRASSLAPHPESPSGHAVIACSPRVLSLSPPVPLPVLTCQSPASFSWTCSQLGPRPLLDHLPAATPPAHAPSPWPERLFLHSETTPPLPSSQWPTCDPQDKVPIP